MRIAFLISIENGLLFDEVWARFLLHVPRHMFAVFVHARQPDKLTPGSFAAEHLVDVNITAQLPAVDAVDADNSAEYARVRDNYDVQRLLIGKAMALDADTNPVSAFMMCTTDSIPIKSFDTMAQYLTNTTRGGTYSVVQFCPHQIKTEAGRKILHMSLVKYIHALRQHPKFASEISASHWYWASPFVVLARAHAEAMLCDTRICKRMSDYQLTNVSTHYPMYILSSTFPEEIVNIPTTMESWNADGGVRVFTEATEDHIQALRFENLLMATGFSAASGIDKKVDHELWAAPPAIDSATGETAQYTGM